MWLVKMTLNRPYTFIVLVLLILLMSVEAILRTLKRVFKAIINRKELQLVNPTNE
jgi:hypothetical protein